jgi:hypothetical protein
MDQVLPEPSQTLIILAYALVVTVAGIQKDLKGLCHEMDEMAKK